MPFLFILLAVVLLIGWLASEFHSRPWVRIVLGVLCLAYGVPFAFIAGMVVQRFDDGARYDAATAELVDATIRQLGNKHSDRVLAELERFRTKFVPSYENHVEKYERLVREFQSRVAPEDKSAQKL